LLFFPPYLFSYPYTPPLAYPSTCYILSSALNHFASLIVRSFLYPPVPCVFYPSFNHDRRSFVSSANPPLIFISLFSHLPFCTRKPSHYSPARYAISEVLFPNGWRIYFNLKHFFPQSFGATSHEIGPSCPSCFLQPPFLFSLCFYPFFWLRWFPPPLAPPPPISFLQRTRPLFFLTAPDS